MDTELRQRVNVYKDPRHFRIADDGTVVAPPRQLAQAEGEEGEEAPLADGGLIGFFLSLSLFLYLSLSLSPSL